MLDWRRFGVFIFNFEHVTGWNICIEFYQIKA